MRDFLSDAGYAALDAFLPQRSSPDRALLAFDYDGTLAGLHPHPDDAVLPEGIFQLLDSLSCVTPVAILTGRSIADVRKFLPPRIHRIVGNHGLEGIPAWKDALVRARAAVDAWRPDIAAALARMPHVLLEDKDYSLTLHAAEGSLEHAAIAELAARLRPLARVILGKGVLNILPADAPHKGAALLELMRMEGFAKATFAGDDVTDEAVFALADPALFGILVGPRSPSAALWRFAPQDRIGELLRYMLAHALAAADQRA